MTYSNNNTIEDLSKDLVSMTKLLNDLVDDMQNNAMSLALLKERLDNINEEVKSLSFVVRDSDSNSIVTRLALLESNNKSVVELDKQESLSKWKLAMIISPGVLALISQVLNYIIGD